MGHDSKHKINRLLARRPNVFDDLMKSYHRKSYLSSDPIMFAHRYSDPRDQEVIGFISACFAYGAVSQINRAIEEIIKPLGKRPSQTLVDPKFIQHAFSVSGAPWEGFVYRFHREGHVRILLKVISKILLKHGSLSEFAKQHYDPRHLSPFENVLNRFTHEILSLMKAETHDQPKLWRGLRFLISPPSEGSACKRMALFFRWMVRSDEIDFGIWDWMPSAALIMPIDTHIARLSYFLRLRSGRLDKAPNWKMAVEITKSLRGLCADDPTRYDFALTRLGILNICKQKFVAHVCENCEIKSMCRYADGARTNVKRGFEAKTCGF